MDTVAVGRETADYEARFAAGDDVEGGSTDESTKDLRQDVGHEMRQRKAAADGEPERDGGVEVASGNVADGIRHGQDGEAESERDSDEADAKTGKSGCENGSAASAKDEPCGSKEFGEETFAEIHFPS
jgi:hypothetical protein